MFRLIVNICLLSVLIFFGGMAAAQPEENISPVQWHPMFKNNIEVAKRFNIRKILELANERDSSGQHRIKSVTSLLQQPLFSELENEFERSSVLMGESRAIFRTAASPDLPRVLNTAGTMAYAYYTDPKHQRAFNSLELIDTDPQTAEMNFYLIEYRSGKPIVVKNQRNCVSCHRTRHNWAIYRLWPGIVDGHSIRDHIRAPEGTSDIGVTMDIWELNMARISRQLLNDRAYRKVERPVIAALLDCPIETFSFDDEQAFELIRKSTLEEYYADAIRLIEDVNVTNNQNISYQRRADGTMAFGTLLNQEDPRRLALVRYFLKKSGSKVNDKEWSTSRRPAQSSILFQASGALGLNRLAYYLIHNSPNAEVLKAMVPDSAKLTHGARSETPESVCHELLSGDTRPITN